MDKRERFRLALNYKESDRVPFDIGGSVVTSIATLAYKKLRDKLEFPSKEIQIQNLFSMSSMIDEDIIEKLGIDTMFLLDDPNMKIPETIEKDGYLYYSDDWGCEYARPKGSNSGFALVKRPLSNAKTAEDIVNFKWLDPKLNINLELLKKRAKFLAEEKKVPVILEPDIGGVFEFPCWLRGTENFYLDLGIQSKIAEAIIDKTLQYKIEYYSVILSAIGKHVDIVRESDDLAGQKGLLISKETYKKFIKPAHKKIFEIIKKNSNAKICIHSCGSIRDLIPDFIDSGIEVLNPVQTSANNMDLKKLKHEFGKDIVFWGAGCDSQYVLPVESPKKISEVVKDVMETLAPGGGFICAPINMIQNDVPPENILAFVDAVREYNNLK